MLNKISFSFIVPVYNAKTTLNRCLDSILVRTTPDYEIILINDSSTDNSLEICEEYAAKYSQVSVYTFPNGGAGTARNRGLEKARGKYIIFCDSDDWYNSEELNKLLDSADEQMKDIDLLCFNYCQRWIDCDKFPAHFSDVTLDLSKDKCFETVSTKALSKEIGIILWNKIFRKEIIDSNHILFPERDQLYHNDDWGEDLIFVIQYVLCCNTVVSISNTVYYNCINFIYGENCNIKYELKNKLFHMTHMLQYLEESYVWHTYYSEYDFSDIYTYQVHNDIYRLNRLYSPKEMASLVKNAPEYTDIKRYLSASVNKWNNYGAMRWGKKANEYKNMIMLLLDGNVLKYKINSFISDKNLR